MKRYRGSHDGSAGSAPVVVVDVAPDGTETTLGLLTHHVRHSPGGFSWGYAGSGPAELARCLLIDALGDAAHCTTCGGSGEIADESGEYRCWECDGEGLGGFPYQAFKFAFVAGWGDSFDIGADEILAWHATVHPERQR